MKCSEQLRLRSEGVVDSLTCAQLVESVRHTPGWYGWKVGRCRSRTQDVSTLGVCVCRHDTDGQDQTGLIVVRSHDAWYRLRELVEAGNWERWRSRLVDGEFR